MFLPILGLMGIVLYGTTRASKPVSLQDDYGEFEVTRSGYTEMEPAQPLERIEPQAPPPAPRLDSVVEAEEEAARQAEAERVNRARIAFSDSVARATTVPVTESPNGDYVPAPVVPFN